ncbi:MAG TPA: 50S ribosomal protein L25 [Chloroflexi bacterium]|nr:50S ribosomal protein L25 [Chloroflexota bacterium]
MEEIELKAQKREVIGKQVKQLRRQGIVPAILYGHRTEPLPLQIEERSLRRVLERVGSHHLITLRVGDDKEPRMTLAREVQLDPITHALLHVDFYEVVMTEKITTEVPLVFIGQSPVMEQREGVLVRGLDSVEVECLPSNLIESIEVNLEDLVEIDQAILVGDLTVGADMEILTDKEEVVAQILPLRAVEEVVEEVVPSEVEIISREREEVEEREEEPPEEVEEE